MEIEIKEDVILINKYDFIPSSIYPKHLLKPDEIKCRVVNFTPNAFILNNNDLIFISSRERNIKELDNFCIVNNIINIKKVDIWSLILEPFVDTEYTNEMDHRINTILMENDIDLMYVDSIRKKLNKIMTEYNIDSGLWDWVYLGLYDLFSAYSGKLVKTKISNDDFRKQYWEYIEIALKGKEELL